MDANRIKKVDSRSLRYMIVKKDTVAIRKGANLPDEKRIDTTYVRLIGKDKKLNFMKYPAQATAFAKAAADKIVKDMGHMYNFKIEPIIL